MLIGTLKGIMIATPAGQALRQRLTTAFAFALTGSWVWLAAAAAPQDASPARPPDGQPSGWSRVIEKGLDDPRVEIIDHLVEFHGQLYASGFQTTAGCRVWRSGDGTTWESVVGPGTATPQGFGNPNNQSINAFLVFQDYLYAGTWNEVNGAELWRTADGKNWEAVVGGGSAMAGGFGKLENSGVTALSGFEGMLIAGTGSLYCKDGVELWLSRDAGSTWSGVAGERIALQTSLARDAKYFLAMKVFQGMLYLATGDQLQGGSEIWRTSDGWHWEPVVGAPSPYRAGMGNPAHDMIYELESYQDALYAAVLDYSRQGGALWRSSDGASWEVIVGSDRASYPPGFGVPGNIGIVSLEPYAGRLYAGTTNEEGAQLWVSRDGRRWQQVMGPDARVPAGFGHPHNRAINALLEFRGRLYAGTHNPQDGAELWCVEALEE